MIDSDFEFVVLFASVTRIVKVDVPVEVGVPEITPVDEFKASPAGKLPDVLDQEYGVLPPLADTVWL